MHILSQIWSNIHNGLFPELEEVLPPLSEMQRKLVAILELVRIEKYAGRLNQTYFGRPKKDRIALARAFIAKAVYNLPTTRLLIEQLQFNESLRRLCGWEYRRNIPSESTFSRAFEEFADSDLPAKVHQELIKTQLKDRLVGHISRDSTAIKGHEKPAPKVKKKSKEPEKPKKRGRPKKGEERSPVELKRIEKQLNQTLEQMLAELPTACDRGKKKDSKGYKHTWNGYKLHLDVDDNGIPIKEEFGACMVRVRGAAKVFAHLMFGILALAADQLLKLVQYVSYYQIVTKTLWRYSAPKSTKFLF